MEIRDQHTGRPARWPLLAAEIAWYLVVLAGVLTHRVSAGYGRGDRTEYYVLLVVAVTCAALALTRWWRPAWTAAVAVVVLITGIVVLLVRPIGPLGPLRQMLSLAVGPVLLAATVRRSRLPVAAAVVVLAVVAAAVDTGIGGFTLSTDLVRVLTGSDPRGPAQILPVAAFVALAPVAVGLALRSADTARRAAGLARIRLEERLSMARDLHDVVANHVTGMILTAQAAGLPDGIPESTAQALRTVETAGDQALGAMRRMVATLRSADLTDLAPAVPGGAQPSSTSTSARTAPAAVRDAIGDDPQVRLDIGDPVPHEVDGEVATTLHRLALEGITNARRHMPAGATIEVELSAPRPGSVTLRITNDRERSRVRGGGFGLVGLRERVDAVGGRLDAGPTGGRRWQILAELPTTVPR